MFSSTLLNSVAGALQIKLTRDTLMGEKNSADVCGPHKSRRNSVMRTSVVCGQEGWSPSRTLQLEKTTSSYIPQANKPQ